MEVLVSCNETKPGGNILFNIEDIDAHEESSWGERVSVFIKQRHMSVSCMGAQSGCSQKGEYKELFAQRVLEQRRDSSYLWLFMK